MNMQTLESNDDVMSDLIGMNGIQPPEPAETPVEPESEYQTDEVVGDPVISLPVPGTESQAGDHDEVGSAAGGESDELAFEASAEQLSAETAGDTSWSDLEGIEGYEAPAPMENSLEESDEEELPDAGEALEISASDGDAEFAFLASLLPTLATAVGPSIVKAVAGKLRPRTRKRLKRFARGAAPVGKKIVRSAIRRGLGKGSFLSSFAKVFESAEMAPSTESGQLVDEALIQETAAVLEVVIGRDDRIRVSGTTKTPWRRVCALRITFPKGGVYRGTGFLIGPRAVATAGHCVYMHSQGGWASKVEVIPGANDSSRPLGREVSRTFRSVGGWINGQKPECDYGCIILPKGAFDGQNLGHFGFASCETSELLAKKAVLGGYPGDKPFAQLWAMSCKIKRVTSDQLIYDIDTAGGQSGAPCYIKRNGQRLVVGIHNYGAQSGNSATRITRPVYRRLRKWSKV